MHKLLLFVSLIIPSYMTLGQSVQDSISTSHDSLETIVSQSCDTADMAKEKNRHRVIVLTDIGGTDFDDFQSMVHFLLYADLFDVEGLISSPMGGQGRINHILKVIDCYEKDYANLKTYSDRYPTPEALRAITRQGAIDSAGLRGYTKPSSGSEWIIQCAKRNDIRPLWILVWGGIDDLAQALHDDPSIQPKLRVYFIGGPNKKWATTAYDYIAREHPNLWIIEANSTYRGWFVGGNQQDHWGNDSFVAKHISGRGTLGEFFAKGIIFESQTRSTIKMGDTPSVVYLLGKTPEDPSRESWGGSFVRSWDRPRYTFRYPPTTEDKIETFSIVEIIYAAGQSTSVDDKATLVVDKQDFPGFADDTGAWHFFFSPKQAKTWNYSIKSTIQKHDKQTGGFTSFWPQPEQAARPSSRYPNWWTDNPDPSVAEGMHQGAKTVSRWREEFLGDFAQRMLRCQSPAPSKPEGNMLNTGGDSKVSKRLRVIILSDFPPLDVIPGGADYGSQEKRSDPDDVQSMVRFLLYVNEFDVEGLVASAGTFANIAKKQNILDILDLYDKVDENLNRHDPRYPTADQLRSAAFQGRSGSWGKPADEILGEGKDSEASEAIIRIVDKPDSRPVWICVWGGPREAAQAIWKVQKTRSPAELERFLSKLRIYMIGLGDKTGQDGSGQWMLDNFPNLFVIVSQKTYHGMFAQKSSIGSLEWLNDKIRRGHGPLGAVYPPAGYNPDNPGMQEGDTPSFLYLVSAVRGMNDPEKPDQESWGGQYQQPDTSRNHWYDGPGAISVSKWLPEIQKDFTMRADWMLPSHATSLKPRIIVLTDISPVNHEPDDMESMIRLLVHADLFEIEGLVATTGWSYLQSSMDSLDLIHKVIDAYERDKSNLLKRSGQTNFLADESRQKIEYWPSPDYLRSKTVMGSKNRGQSFIGEGNDSAGSNRIIQCVDESDDRPVWIQAWGGGNTLAQAIWRVRKERSEEELKTFLHKIRMYTITDQDRDYRSGIPFDISSHQWMRREFEKELFFIWDECAWKFQNSTGKSNWDEYATHIQRHGNLGEMYPKYKYGVEGDTPAFLYVMPNGLNNPEVPGQGSWGGYFAWAKGPDNETYAYTNHQSPAYNICQKLEKHFYQATFNNFAARMDWAKDGAGNRNPVVVINDDESIDILTKKPLQGTKVTLDASKTYDPDGDNLKFNWWIQSDAGTYTQDIKISNSNSSRATIEVPEDSAAKTFHVICEVIDDGTHNLSGYRRIIFEPVQ